MQKFNLHTHTERCGHALGLDEQYIKAAIKGGFQVLGFSDHIPFKGVNKPSDRMNLEEFNNYIQSLKSLKKKYESQIDLKIGLEVEYFEDREEEIVNLYKQVDYLILGQHCKYIDYEYDIYCSDEDVEAYVEAIEKGLATRMFTYLAHPDYCMLGRRDYNKTCEEAAHRIAKASLKYDVPLELNLKGKLYGTFLYKNTLTNQSFESIAYPFIPFWEVIAQYNCKVVYGYDAHHPLSLVDREQEKQMFNMVKHLDLNIIDSIKLK